jgi:hypothetical protein
MGSERIFFVWFIITLTVIREFDELMHAITIPIKSILLHLKSLWDTWYWSWLTHYVTSQNLMEDLRFSRQWLWRMASPGMLSHVALVRTDVLEELSASIIRMTRIGELGTTLAITGNRRTLRRNTKWALVTLMKEALNSSETSVPTRATRRNIPEDAILQLMGLTYYVASWKLMGSIPDEGIAFLSWPNPSAVV